MQLQHKFYEDIFAILCSAVMVALGLSLFKAEGLLTGGTAGIALILSHIIPANFGLVFFLVNVPFYYLSVKQLGWQFTLKTFISVTLVSVLVEHMPQWVEVKISHPLFAALAGGLLIGVGLLVLFRHKSSLGGIGILAFYLQNKFGLRAGKFQMAVDMGILTVSLIISSPIITLLSVVGAVMMNMVIAVNHKPGRYQSTLTQTEAQPAN
ncbi:YitT family protein [Neptunicella marina]|uniref:YitT family protein n=1 Tax=Neptunicella marina TaxID=2125989 RepID=A0A8J6IT63_9ALTE|nr:YitT family protein [Neptunicella marina]MBC3765422.1 YitT family protein [Neptunicella marina]